MKTYHLLAGCLFGCVLLLLPSCGTTGNSNDKAKVEISPRLSEDKIRDEIFKYTPIGSTLVNVKEFARTRLKYVGPAPYEDGPATRRHWPGPDEEIGVRSVGVCLGDYGFPGRIDTYIHWAFDQNDKLIDVVVEKERDSL